MTGTVLTDQQIADVAAKAGFTGNDLPIAIAVCLAESGGNIFAKHTNVGGSIDYGLWQINSVHRDLLGRYAWNKADDNAKMAYAVFKSSGWRAWTTYNTKAYLMFMGRAKKPTQNKPDPVPHEDLPQSGSNFGKWITDPHMWKRYLFFGVGITLVIIALFKMTGDNKLSDTTKGLVKTAVKLAVIPK